jgi:hypothetical protein
VPGCHHPSTTYGHLCTTHKKHQRRHGHPRQQSVNKTKLKPHLRLVRQIIERNPESQIWPISRSRWDLTVQHARERAAYAGTMSSFEREACEALLRVADNVETMDVLQTVCAFQFLVEDDPRLFWSDRAIDHQLARRVLALTDVNAGSYWDPKKQRVTRVYRDMAPRVIPWFVELVRAAFGELAVILVRKEREKEARLREEQRAFREAADELRTIE